MKYDIIIKNGLIIDGTGNRRYKGDVAITGNCIVSIGEEITCDADTIINAEGMVVSPGFIDPHAHNDGYIFYDSSNIYKLAQGITTEISGNCGEGLTPVSDEFFDEIFEYYRPYYPLDDFKTYTSGKIFYEKIDKLSLGTNIGFLCAHGTLRMNAMGFSNRRATDDELEKMKTNLAECMESGALGMSTGLVYSPGCFADIDELCELCKVVKEHGGYYATHIRSEGFKLVEAVKEAIEISRRTGVRTVISHLKALGKNYWGMSKETTHLIEEAQNEGLDIFCDQYPYATSCSILHWVIPPEYTEGGFVKMCSKLSEPIERQRIKDMYLNKFGPWDNLMENITPAGIHILKADKTPDAEGKTLLEYAQFLHKDPYDVLFDTIIENKADALAAFDCMCEEDICRIMQKEYCMVGTDGIDVKPEEKTHPRLTGAFPRVLGRYVRDMQVLSLEKAIRKMTSLPAHVLNFDKKGILKEGYDADICVFNPETVLDMGTYDDFNVIPHGIQYVIVDGIIAFKDGKYTGAASGKRIGKGGTK